MGESVPPLALRQLVDHPSVDLDTRDSQGRSLEERARSRWEKRIFNFLYSHFVCCLVSEFAEGERIVIEARRQRRRMEEERQQLANKQVADSGNVADKADGICWFCHGDVTSLENNKCAGCRKVTHNSDYALCRS